MAVSLAIIATITVGAFLLSLMLGKRYKLPADKFLITYLAFLIISQIYFYFEAQGTFQHTSWMLMGRGIYLLGGPLFFYYVYVLTTSKQISLALYVWTLLPFICYTVHFLYYYLFGFSGENVQIENGLLYINSHIPVTWGFFVILLIINDPFYLVWFYILLRRYRKRTVHEFSALDKINLKWLNVVFYLWALSVLILLPVLAFSVGQRWFGSEWISLLLQLDYLVFIFLLGFYGFRQSAVFSVAEYRQSEEKPAPAYERSGLTREDATLQHQRLLEYMKTERPYLAGELTAQQLAQQLDLSPNHLSQIINQLEGKNFFDFINYYRVEEVKRRMTDSRNNNLTLLAIALESGFNSKSSFNTVFKKLTGQTPSAYQKSLNVG